ncbi:MAG: hypothetical protein ABW069_09625 [Duganella sp.]
MAQSALLFRCVALVSYGTGFLRKELPLEDWYRHGIFFDARFQFRSPGQNALLAGEFTNWLDSLAHSGAKRLSLHRMDEFDIAVVPAAGRLDYAVVAHFPDRYQIWAAGNEAEAWEAETYLSPGRAYAGDIDSYWLVAERRGQLDIPATNWKETAAAIAKDLDFPVPSSQVPVPTGPFFPDISTDQEWAKLPLFPTSPRASLAHRIVATLDWKRGQFDNDTNPKNEYNLYLSLDDEGCRKLTEWSDRLDRWLTDVLLRAANEFGEAGLFKPIHPPAKPASSTPRQADIAENEGAMAMATATAAEPDRKSAGKWSARLRYLLALAILGLLLVALAP